MQSVHPSNGSSGAGDLEDKVVSPCESNNSNTFGSNGITEEDSTPASNAHEAVLSPTSPAATATISTSAPVRKKSSTDITVVAREELEVPLRNVDFGAIVKVYCISTAPSFSMPWQKARQRTSTSSGFVIAGNRIITNAHGVKYYSHVRVRKHGHTKKYNAKVVCIGHDCDLAVLTIEEEEFWKGIRPLEFGGIPHLQDSVICVGYPTGGDNISVTKGVVSRIDFTDYTHSGEQLLAIQIDAAINAGNSGGPAIMDGKVVGVAFETLEHAENIGYMIPVPIITHFLEDVQKRGVNGGFCGLGFNWQIVENATLRKYLKMRPDQHGVLIIKIQPLGPAAKVFKPYDVLLALDGVAIADDGTVKFRGDERISFRYLLTKMYRGDPCQASILRDGEELVVTMTTEPMDYLIPVQLYDKQPTYYIYGGLVFTILSQPFLAHEYGAQWTKRAPIRLCEQAFYGVKEDLDQQIVILNQVLVSNLNVGYEDIRNTQVSAVNGVKIKNIKHLVQVVEAQTTPFIRFDLDYNQVIIVDMKEAAEVEAGILRDNNISNPKSDDLMILQEENKGSS